MKILVIFFIFFILFGCGGPDGEYQGKVANNLCALEVFPPNIAEYPDSLKASSDSAAKNDPLVRQNGIMVCRSY